MNPFSLTIAQGRDFCNREQERAELIRHAEGGAHVVLFSPRRYGKSSLAREILSRLGRKGFITAYVDLFPVASEHDLVVRLATAVFKAIGGEADPRSLTDRLKGFFGRLIPTVELTPEGVSIAARFDRNAEPDLLLDDLMAGIGKSMEKNEARGIIVLDEFQEITGLNEAKKIEGILRSHIQFQKNLSYFFVGSRRRVLQDMFTDRGRPFYKSAFLYTLKEIPRDDLIPYICERFKSAAKKCTPAVAGEIYDLVRGYPYYVQKLAAIAWDLTAESCDAAILRQAYEALLAMEAMDFAGTWSGLTLTQKAVLAAIAREPTTSPYARDYLQRYRLSAGGVQKAIQVLVIRDLIEKDDSGCFRLTDPVMAAWLTRS